MPIAFQPNAFQTEYPGDTAFQGFERAVHIESSGLINIFRAMPRITKGASIVFKVVTTDPLLQPPLRYDPASVTITIKDSLGATIVNAASMTSTGEFGEWIYLYQSDGNDVEGFYEVSFTAVDGIYTDKTQSIVSFLIVPA